MIDVRDLRFKYTSKGPDILQGMDFSIKPGEVFGFLGPSGAGKSTTQKILIGLLKGYRGEVKILDKPVVKWGSDLYEKVGVSFELPNHFPKLTARENLDFFASLYQAKSHDVLDVLSWVGLEDDADKRVSGYSKGMKNRLSVARALVHNPDLIFLDEPTAGLDPVSTQRIHNLVLRLKSEGKTVVINTHNMQLAEQICDRVAFIYQGQIREIDSPQELKLRFGEPKVRVEYTTNHRVEQREFPLQNLGAQAEFIQLLQAHPVRTIHSREASLDDIFRQLTGAELLGEAQQTDMSSARQEAA